MGIVVRSPFSGQPVKIRDQDVGRAVRDEENRIFYALPKSDGSGYYGAPTRAGGPKDEAKAQELEAKVGAMKDQSQARQAEAQVHDATGKPRRGKGRLVLIILALIAIALGGAYVQGYLTPLIEAVQGQSSPDGADPASTPDASGDADAQAGPAPEAGAKRVIPAAPLTEQVRLPHRYLTQLPPRLEKLHIEFDVTQPAEQVVDAGEEPSPAPTADDDATPGPDVDIFASAAPMPPSVTVGDHSDAPPQPTRPAIEDPDPEPEPKRAFNTLPGGVSARVDTLGRGTPIEIGERVAVHYIGMLPDGTVFDSSYERDQPLRFRLGTGRVIRGWDIGIVGMRPGEQRTLRVPAHLAYGSRGVPGLIPPDTALAFEITLLGRPR